MCQLNLYIVPKSVSKDKVLKLMQKYFVYDKPECVNDDNLLVEVQAENNIFVSAGMGCNCGTVQSSFQEEEAKLPWTEFKSFKIQEEKERISKIKALIGREDYLEYKADFYKKVEEFGKYVAQGDSASDEKVKEYQKFIKDNEILLHAMRFELHDTANGKEIVLFNENEDMQGNEERELERTETEFDSLKGFVDEILKDADELKLLSFWQDEYSPKLQSEEYVFQDEFKIEDIIYLKYNQLLTIFKR